MLKGDIIRILRERKGWSQQQLADEIGLSRSMVSMFEIDKRVPSAETPGRIRQMNHPGKLHKNSKK